MAQEVKLRICGVQGQAAEDNIEVVSVGQMYEEDGFVCLAYDEVVDESENGVVEVVKNVLKIREDQVEILKEGPTQSHMVFVPNETTYTYYSTPLGELEVSVFTEEIRQVRRTNGFRLTLRYDLEMNSTFVSKCSVDIVVEE